jgi:hypothetical protein
MAIGTGTALLLGAGAWPYWVYGYAVKGRQIGCKHPGCIG